MTYAGVVARLSVLVAVVSVVIYHPALQFHRQKLSNLLSTCPLHWFSGASEENNVNNIIRYQNDYVMTKEELADYHGGENSKGLYIGIMGRVYDVSAGYKHYGPGGGYSFFAGRDGSKAFVSGEFNEAGLVDDVTGLKSGQMMEILNWIHFYEKTYHYVGKVAGNFYNTDGSPTAALYAAQTVIENELEEQRQAEDMKKIFPPCNTYWSENTGSKVWCTENSGGYSRGWEGVPQLLFNPVTKSTQCACVRTSGSPSDSQTEDTGEGDLRNVNLREYEDCDRLSNVCILHS